MSKVTKKLILFIILNFNLFAGDTLMSVGGLVINLPSGHSFQQVVTTGEAPKNRQCFEDFITNKVSKISFPNSRKTVFEQVSELGFFPEIRLGQRSSSQVTSDRFSFSMRDLGNDWCDEGKQKVVLKKLKREVTVKIKRVLGKRLVSSLVRLNGDEDLASCNCSDLSEFKFNETDGIAYFPNGAQVKNEELLSRLYKFFHAERSAKRTRHIIPGTELLDILGGKECLIRRYRRDEHGELKRVYCAPKTSGTGVSVDSTEQEASSEQADESETADGESSNTHGDQVTIESEEITEEEIDEEDEDIEGDEDQSSEESQSADDYAAAEIQRQLDQVRALERRLAEEKSGKKVPGGVYAQLHEQLQEINVQGFSEGENGEIYDSEGNQVHNETLIERYFDETSPPDEDVNYGEEVGQGDANIIEDEDSSHEEDGSEIRNEDEDGDDSEEDSHDGSQDDDEDENEDEDDSEDDSEDLD